MPETGGTADPDGECKNDPVDQPAGSNCADGGNDHTDGSALQKRCCVCKLDQCIYHPGVHRNDATDGDAVYDIMSVSEREQPKFVHRERRMWIMIAAKAASSTEGANHDIMSARESEGACSLLTNGEIME